MRERFALMILYDQQVTEFRKNNLLHGLDEIGLTLLKSNEIGAFEAASRGTRHGSRIRELGTSVGSNLQTARKCCARATPEY